MNDIYGATQLNGDLRQLEVHVVVEFGRGHLSILSACFWFDRKEV
jgi:hypothetical protein